jgi:hypothetical protein
VNKALRNAATVTGGKPIAVRSHSILGVNAVNPLVAFYDMLGRKSQDPIFLILNIKCIYLFFIYFVHTKETIYKYINYTISISRIAETSKIFLRDILSN